MPVNAPQTRISWFELPQEQQVPRHRHADHQPSEEHALLRALHQLSRQNDRIIELLEGLQDPAPQTTLLIDRAGPGLVTSDVFRRRMNNLVVQVYASGPTPNATITVLDAPIGGTPILAADNNATRTVTGTVKYFVFGVLDEIVVQAQITAGTISVAIGWADAYPRGAGTGPPYP